MSSEQFPPDFLDSHFPIQAPTIEDEINEANRFIIHPDKRHIDDNGVIEESDLYDAREHLAYTALDDSVDPAPTKPTLEELIERGKLARSRMDAGKWQLCDLAVQVVVAFNDDTLGEWAQEIGVASSTARHYRRMGTFYDYADRLAKLDQWSDHDECNVYFSHFADALVLPTPALAYEWLNIVAGGHWSVDFARAELQKWMSLRGYEKRKPGKQPSKAKANVVCEKVGVYSPTFTQKNGVWQVTFKLSEEEDMVKALIDRLINQKQPLYLSLEKISS